MVIQVYNPPIYSGVKTGGNLLWWNWMRIEKATRQFGFVWRQNTDLHGHTRTGTDEQGRGGRAYFAKASAVAKALADETEAKVRPDDFPRIMARCSRPDRNGWAGGTGSYKWHYL